MNYRAWGLLLVAVAIAMMIFLAFIDPRALVVGGTAALAPLIFGALMLTGRWPTRPKR
ncbi:hypothetical protein [Deinococcus radiopugnans]|uniref:hypothetical protein n=1 Tax=Deinococcus radiopugnans TaxID=57497 RepID=UPI0012E059B9|nr:hypothetical protein [Deinococcus radiopugnans]